MGPGGFMGLRLPGCYLRGTAPTDVTPQRAESWVPGRLDPHFFSPLEGNPEAANGLSLRVLPIQMATNPAP